MGNRFGALFAGVPTNKFGRKKTLIWIGALYTLSALGSALAWDPYSFSFFRFIGGLGVGASSVAAPTYISEISNRDNRGRLVILYQFNIVLGIFIAFFSNYLLQGVGEENDWRWMLGVEAIPAFIYTIMVLGVPKSPRWLITKHNDLSKAEKILRQMNVKDVHQSIKEIKKSADSVALESIWAKKYRTPVVLAFILAFFNQLSGINFILYYAPEILERAGLATKESLQSSISIGGVNLLFTMIGIYLIDRAGRKSLMILGSIGYIIGLSMVAYSFYSGASPTFMLTFLLVFIAAHAIGQGAVIWVFISEIFPNTVRAYGQSWGSGTHWVFAALITLLAPVVIDLFKENPWPIFAFFAIMMVFQLLWVLIYMPETRGVSLEDLSKKLLRS